MVQWYCKFLSTKRMVLQPSSSNLIHTLLFKVVTEFKVIDSMIHRCLRHSSTQVLSPSTTLLSSHLPLMTHVYHINVIWLSIRHAFGPEVGIKLSMFLKITHVMFPQSRLWKQPMVCIRQYYCLLLPLFRNITLFYNAKLLYYKK